MLIKFFLFIILVSSAIAIHQENRTPLRRMFGIQIFALFLLVLSKGDFTSVATILFNIILIANMIYALFTERHNLTFYICLPVVLSITIGLFNDTLGLLFDLFCFLSVFAFIYQVIKNVKIHNLSLLIVVFGTAILKVTHFLNFYININE